MQNTPNYELKTVAFLDIVGFSSFVDSLSEQPENILILHEALNCFKRRQNMAGAENTSFENIRMSAFSDSIVISAPPDEAGNLIVACGYLQSELLAGGMATRGGIARGMLHHEDGIMYGKGMLSAYCLEKDVAITPRVIIS